MDDGERECLNEMYGDCKVSSKAFRVDCPHQEGDTMRGDGAAGDDGVR